MKKKKAEALANVLLRNIAEKEVNMLIRESMNQMELSILVFVSNFMRSILYDGEEESAQKLFYAMYEWLEEEPPDVIWEMNDEQAILLIESIHCCLEDRLLKTLGDAYYYDFDDDEMQDAKGSTASE